MTGDTAQARGMGANSVAKKIAPIPKPSARRPDRRVVSVVSARDIYSDTADTVASMVKLEMAVELNADESSPLLPTSIAG